MILHMNVTEYMTHPSRAAMVQEYAEAVDTAVQDGKLTGPFTSTCPECGSVFVDADEAHEDTEHIIITLTSDNFAVVVACEGYFVVNPNSVGFDAQNWQPAGN